MLLNNLYTIQSLSENGRIIRATALLQADHAIFKGHFPGQPVLPGVCMLEMITEITRSQLNQKFRITAAPQIKFLNMIDPGKDPLIEFEIKYALVSDKLTLAGSIHSGPRVFMKFQMTLEPVGTTGLPAMG